MHKTQDLIHFFFQIWKHEWIDWQPQTSWETLTTDWLQPPTTHWHFLPPNIYVQRFPAISEWFSLSCWHLFHHPLVSTFVHQKQRGQQMVHRLRFGVCMQRAVWVMVWKTKQKMTKTFSEANICELDKPVPFHPHWSSLKGLSGLWG